MRTLNLEGRCSDMYCECTNTHIVYAQIQIVSYVTYVVCG